MKKLFLSLCIIPFVTFSQVITPDMFVNPINTGVNMSLAFVEISELDQFQGNQIGAFFDINNDGVLECVGLGDVDEEFFIFSVWGDDELTDNKDGLDFGDTPYFSILTSDSLIIMISDLDSFNGYESNAINFNNNVYITATYCEDELACNFIVFEYLVDEISSNCYGLIGCTDSNFIEFNIYYFHCGRIY